MFYIILIIIIIVFSTLCFVQINQMRHRLVVEFEGELSL